MASVHQERCTWRSRATIDMTMRYAHLSPDVKRDAVQHLDRKATQAIRETSQAT